MIALFHYIRQLQTSSFIWLYKTIMQCLFKAVHQCFVSSRRLPYQNTVVSEYCEYESVHAYRINTRLARTEFSSQNNLHILSC